MKAILFLLTILPFLPQAQTAGCVFKQPFITIHFGSGNVRDLNAEPPPGYRRISGDCPPDGYYTYIAATTDCFGGDWLTIPEDHTPGDADGNMMLVNAAWNSSTFLTTAVNGLKSGTVYEFGVWLMNVCKPSDKCPFPLLPNISITLQEANGRAVAQFNTGELVRRNAPQWSQYTGVFTAPAGASLTLMMTDNAPGGCGNDFVLDDITFRECVKPTVITAPKIPPVVKQQPTAKPVVKREPPLVQKRTKLDQTGKPQETLSAPAPPVANQRTPALPAPPPVLTTRENPLVKRIETEAGEIRFDLYDNGEIDGDTVSIYHNNVLVKDRAGLSQKPVSFRITVDAAHPHHELVMVADNLGSIPPNTSLMIVTTATGRYEVFISSTEQKNARLVIDLKE